MKAKVNGCWRRSRTTDSETMHGKIRRALKSIVGSEANIVSLASIEIRNKKVLGKQQLDNFWNLDPVVRRSSIARRSTSGGMIGSPRGLV